MYISMASYRRPLGEGVSMGCRFLRPCCCPQGSSMFAWGDQLQEDGLLLHGPLLGCRELLLHAWSISCPCTLTVVPAGLLLSFFTLYSPTCCCAAVFPFFNLLSQRCSQYCSLSQLLQRWVPLEPSGTTALIQHEITSGLWSEDPLAPTNKTGCLQSFWVICLVVSTPKLLCTPRLFTWGIVQETEDLNTVQALYSNN